MAPLFQSLFLEHDGLIDVNAAAKDQYTFFNSSHGGIFIRHLFAAMVSNMDDGDITWNELLDDVEDDIQAVYRANNGIYGTDGSYQAMQNLGRFWTREGWPGRGVGGNAPLGTWHPEVGDVIVEINGQNINTPQDCIDAVNRSPEIMTFVTRGKRTGRLFTYQTRLRSGGSRFGVNLAGTGGSGSF